MRACRRTTAASRWARRRSPRGGLSMCLAIPGKVVETYDRQGLRMSKVEFGGITREVCLEYVPEARLGDFVLVHVGFALSVVDAEEAARTFELLEQMGQLTELEVPQEAEKPPGPE